MLVILIAKNHIINIVRHWTNLLSFNVYIVQGITGYRLSLSPYTYCVSIWCPDFQFVYRRFSFVLWWRQPDFHWYACKGNAF